jgi:hypothetical protein
MKNTLVQGLKKVVMLAALMCVLVTVAGADVGPLANLTEKWNEQGTWQSTAGNQYYPVWSWNGSAIGVAYAGQSALSVPPVGMDSQVFAIDATAGGRFVGNFATNGIFEVSFDIHGNQLSGGVYFYFVGSRHTWFFPLVVPAAVTTVTVPLTFSAAWLVSDLNGGETPSAALMQADLEMVKELGITALKKGITAESLTVDNLKLTGPWNGSFTDGIADAWRLEHGLATTNGGAADDPDKDGFSNYGEFLAGTNPNDAKSTFTVSIGKNGKGETVVSWKHEHGRVFNVIRTTDLVSQNAGNQPLVTVPSVAPKNEVVVDEKTDNGPFFYKVGIQE